MTNSQKPELLLCPFCGEKAAAIKTVINCVECSECRAHGPIKALTSNAIEAWNTRAGGWQDIDDMLVTVLNQAFIAGFRNSGPDFNGDSHGLDEDEHIIEACDFDVKTVIEAISAAPEGK